jgi:hypothetical protein
VEFSITKDDVFLPKVCPVLGIPLEVGTGNGPIGTSPTLDRIVPDKGYVPGNVAVISHRANTLKSDGTPEELLAVAAWVRDQINQQEKK